MTTDGILFARALGRTVRAHREIRKVSLAKLAKSLGYTVSGWSRVETGQVTMTSAQLFLAARELGIEPHVLVMAAETLFADTYTTAQKSRPNERDG